MEHMGEVMSKSQGKVYVGDVCDFNVEGDRWIIAEIISVDDHGLSVLSHSAGNGKAGKVCHLDFRDSHQKERVAPAGTYTGNVGLVAASARATNTTATTTPLQRRPNNHQQRATASPQSKPTIPNKPLQILTATQQQFVNQYKVDTNVDYFDGTRWIFAKIVSINTSTTPKDSMAVELHSLGDSNYTNTCLVITSTNKDQTLAKFATKALL